MILAQVHLTAMKYIMLVIIAMIMLKFEVHLENIFKKITNKRAKGVNVISFGMGLAQ